MRILYLTTSLPDEVFQSVNELFHGKLNPAGQNFHDRIIHSIATKRELEIFSLLPPGTLLPFDKHEDENCTYHFIPRGKDPIKNFFFLPGEIAAFVINEIRAKGEQTDEICIVFDSLNLTLAKASLILKRKLHAKIVPVCSDDPHFLTGTKPYYQKHVLKCAAKADGYLCLTRKLNEIFNPNGKPFILFPGVVENTPKLTNKEESPYLYYGGALFEKDGTGDLIRAYKAHPSSTRLVIAGHGAYEQEAESASKEIDGFSYKGLLSKKDNLAYIQNAELCINPRRPNPELAEVSIPSKVLEYLAYGKAVASTPHPVLKELFPDDINWIEEPLDQWWAAHLDENGNLIGIKENKAQERVLQEFGFESVGKKLLSLLESL